MANRIEIWPYRVRINLADGSAQVLENQRSVEEVVADLHAQYEAEGLPPIPDDVEIIVHPTWLEGWGSDTTATEEDPND